MAKKIKIILIHIVIAAVIIMCCSMGCPIYKIFSVPCPACGTTRAWLCFFRGELKSAFAYNAFFPIIPLYVFLFVHADKSFLRNVKFTDIVLYIVSAMLFLYNSVRIINTVIT